MDAIDYLKAQLARTEFCEKVRKTLDRYQLLLTPQMPVTAWPADPGPFEGLPDLGGKPAHSIFDRVPFMYPFNLTGYPAANVPCGFTREELPVGLQIVGRWHRERTCSGRPPASRRSSPGRRTGPRSTEDGGRRRG